MLRYRKPDAAERLLAIAGRFSGQKEAKAADLEWRNWPVEKRLAHAPVHVKVAGTGPARILGHRSRVRIVTRRTLGMKQGARKSSGRAVGLNPCTCQSDVTCQCYSATNYEHHEGAA